MYDKHYTKEEMRFRYRDETVRIIRSLTRYRYTPSGDLCFRYSQSQLASLLHLTIAQMSRVATGVCVLSGPAFMVLREIYERNI